MNYYYILTKTVLLEKSNQVCLIKTIKYYSQTFLQIYRLPDYLYILSSRLALKKQKLRHALFHYHDLLNIAKFYQIIDLLLFR